MTDPIAILTQSQLTDLIQTVTDKTYNKARSEFAGIPTNLWLKVDQISYLFGKSSATVRRVLHQQRFNIEGKSKQQRNGSSWEVMFFDAGFRWDLLG